MANSGDMGTRRRYAQTLALLGVIATCAVTARLVRHEETPSSVPLDPASISVDGIRLGMTEQEVEAIKGPPTERKIFDDGAICLTHNSYDMVMLSKDNDGNFAVVQADGSVVGIGSRSILRPGESDSAAQETLKTLGQPLYQKQKGCGFFPSPFRLLTLGFFDKFEGRVSYPNGLTIEVIGGEYRGAFLLRPQPRDV